jgi:hypothetical protein
MAGKKKATPTTATTTDTANAELKPTQDQLYTTIVDTLKEIKRVLTETNITALQETAIEAANAYRVEYRSQVRSAGLQTGKNTPVDALVKQIKAVGINFAASLGSTDRAMNEIDVASTAMEKAVESANVVKAKQQESANRRKQEQEAQREAARQARYASLSESDIEAEEKRIQAQLEALKAAKRTA